MPIDRKHPHASAIAAARTCSECGAIRAPQEWQRTSVAHVDCRPRSYWLTIYSGSSSWQASVGSPGGLTMRCPGHRDPFAAFVDYLRGEQRGRSGRTAAAEQN